MHSLALLALVGAAAAAPKVPFYERNNPLYSRSSFSGVATFNDYNAQGNTVCGPKQGDGGSYGAAAGDASPNISGGLCNETPDMSKCNGQKPVDGYQGPSCPTGNCGTCYKVTNMGAYGGNQIGGVGNTVTVTIIDVCPSVSAWNYCKTDVPADERCGDSSSDALDIDISAYKALTGQDYSSSLPNLMIGIDPC